MKADRDEDLTGFFSDDHRRIDVLLAAFSAELEPVRARAALEEFERRLLRHIDWEERLLFPAFEAALGEEAAPTAVSMRAQHEELQEQLAHLKTTLREGGAARRNAEEVLIETLQDHNHAEEDYIYPWIEAVLAPGERSGLLKSVRAQGAGRSKSSVGLPR